MRLSVLVILVFVFLNKGYSEEPRLKRIGPQIHSTVVQAAAFSEAANGDSYVFTVVRGTPAHLVVFKVGEQKPFKDFELKGTGGSWDITRASDGSIYMTGDQSIYRYVLGDSTVSDLGAVLPGEKSVWVLTKGEDGEIFGGTFPGGKVFRYHPNDGFTDIGKGSIVKGEQYVRSLVYRKATAKMYAGIGSHAQLIEFDPLSGKKINILPSEFADYQFVYDMSIVEGSEAGDFLFAWLKGEGKESTTLVFDLKTRKVITQLPGNIKVKSILKGNDNKLIYYTRDGRLYSIDFSKSSAIPIEVSDKIGDSYSMQWDESNNLISFRDNGSIVKYSLSENIVEQILLDLPKQPIPIHTILNGPDGRIWSAGYLSGGNSAYDPKTKQSTEYPGLSQAEGMISYDNDIYFGLYTGSKFYKYNVTQSWNLRDRKPEFIGKADGQDRPFGSAIIESKNKVFFGTVPTYGRLGGSLVELNRTSNGMDIHSNIIPSQSIVSILNYKGMLIGGTSTSGGLGIEPSEKEAKLFFWDVGKRKVIYEVVPVKGKRSVTGLALDPKGMIWGMADGTLFVFDPKKRKVIKEMFIHTVASTGQIWRNGSFVFHPSGQVYGTAFNGLFRIDPATMKLTHLAEGALGLIMGKNKEMYFIKEGELWSYDWE